MKGSSSHPEWFRPERLLRHCLIQMVPLQCGIVGSTRAQLGIDGALQDINLWGVDSARTRLDMAGASAGCHCLVFQQYKGIA